MQKTRLGTRENDEDDNSSVYAKKNLQKLEILPL